MNAVFLMIVHVITDQSAKMLLVQRDHMIQNLAAATSDPALRRSVLPWRLNTGALRLEAGCLQEADHIGIEFRIVVEDDISIGSGLGECFT